MTHDVDLGQQTLEKLVSMGHNSPANQTEVKVPRYDKSANEGKGDRASPKSWPTVKAPIDIVLFEGWMLGFTPVSEEIASEVSLGIQ